MDTTQSEGFLLCAHLQFGDESVSSRKEYQAHTHTPLYLTSKSPFQLLLTKLRTIEVRGTHMSTLEFVQGVSTSTPSAHGRERSLAKDSARGAQGTSKLWMVLDAITILGAAVLAELYELRTGPLTGAKRSWHGTLILGRPMWILLSLLCGFAVALVVTSKRLHLYSPMRLESILHEQRLSAQACLTSGLLLTGSLYLIHADDIPRCIVLVTLGGIHI